MNFIDYSMLSRLTKRPLLILIFLGGTLFLAACDQQTPPPATPQSTAVSKLNPTAPQVSPTIEIQPNRGAATQTGSNILDTQTPLTQKSIQDAPISVSANPTIRATQTPGPTQRSIARTTVPSPTRAKPSATATRPHVSPTAEQTTRISVSGKVEAVASGYGSPDDLVVAPSGDIIFGDFGNKAVNIIGKDGKPRALATGLNEPEGLVVAKDGAIIVAEQGTNRVLEINAQTGKVKTLRQLENRTGKDGVDGLGLDPSTGDILIADSPNGRLLRMSRDGSSLKTIATGFVRPTGAAVEASGNIIVVDEFGNAVYRLKPDKNRVKIADIYQPDDIIIGSDTSIYVNSLGGSIVRIDPITSRTKILMSGLKLPHGLGIDSAGRLVIGEAGRNRIFRLTP